jgi:putative tricarboxylic transport membrane protein
MRIHDSLIGGVLLVLSLAVLWHVQSFPPAAGQNFGPALFPGLAAAGLGLCALVLTWQGLRSRQPLLALGDGMRSSSAAWPSTSCWPTAWASFFAAS